MQMKSECVEVTFSPSGITIQARAGDTVLDAALDNGLDLPHDCGGNCACTTCHIRVDCGLENLSVMDEVENDRLSTADGRTRQSRLACQALLRGGHVAVTPLEIW